MRRLESIDKSSSAELSEAINSMYNWYKKAHICYAYLPDVPTSFSVRDPVWGGVFDIKKVFRSSRWFSRGWTLQELIAPLIVEFYALDWTEIGTKSELHQELSEITGINIRVLAGADPSTCNVGERMSWAAFRNTTRVEDMAYCLLGIFQVNMPLVYGEGERSFIRLQEEIMKTSEDYTLFAWPIQRSLPSSNTSERMVACRGLLAESITEFRVGYGFDRRYSDMQLFDPSRLRNQVPNSVFNAPETLNILDTPPVLTSRGLRLHIPLLKNPDGTYSAFLYCRMRPEKSMVCISLVQIDSGQDSLMKKVFSGNGGLHLVPAENIQNFKATTVYVRQGDQREDYQGLKQEIRSHSCDFCIDSQTLEDCKLTIGHIFPPSQRYNLLKDVYISLSPNQSGVLLLHWGTTDSFIVRFGLQHYGPWCEILLESVCLDKRGKIRSLNYFNSLGQEEAFDPNEENSFNHHIIDSSGRVEKHRVKLDRATKRLYSGLANVCVAVRRLPSYFMLQISIC